MVLRWFPVAFLRFLVWGDQTRKPFIYTSPADTRLVSVSENGKVNLYQAWSDLDLLQCPKTMTMWFKEKGNCQTANHDEKNGAYHKTSFIRKTTPSRDISLFICTLV